MATEPSRVGERTIDELISLLDSNRKFVFRSVDSANDVLTYEVFTYSEDRDVALFISLERTIVYEAIYDDLASLIEAEPINLEKFTVQNI